MKIAKKTKKERVALLNPIIPLERPPDRELKKGDYVNLKCHLVPGDPNSNTYEIHVPYFGTGTPEEWLIFVDRLWKGITGQNITSGPARFQQAERSLKGECLATFKLKSTRFAQRTVPNFEVILNQMTSHIFPVNAYREQKRYLRRYVKKPKDLSVRDFISRVQELNNYLDKFPTDVEGVMGTRLPDDELKEIIYHAIPNSWRKQMTLQGFNYPTEDIVEMIRFCEQRLEAMEPKAEISAKKKKSKSSGKKTSSKKKVKVTWQSSEEEEEEESSEDEKPQGRKYCRLHGMCSHTTDACRDLKEMIAKYKRKKYKDHGKAKKKTTYSKHEMNALVKKSVRKALGKNKHRSKKKAKEELQAIESHDMDISEDEKSTKSDSSSSSSSSSSLSSHSSDDF